MKKIFMVIVISCLNTSSKCIEVTTLHSPEDDYVDHSRSVKKLYYYLPPASPLPSSALTNPSRVHRYDDDELCSSYRRQGYVPALLPYNCLLPPVPRANFHTVTTEENPLLAALILSASLGVQPKIPGFNHPDHLPLNPYVALLLSHYGKYAPIHGTGRGLYGYAAANNYHNNKPFGAYKIYEDTDG